MTAAKQRLSYAIQKHGEFVVVALRGALTRDFSAILEKFQEELAAGMGHYIVMSLAGLTDVDHIMMPRLIRIQQNVREQRGRLQVYIPDPELRRSLEIAGAVRKEELAPSPEEAVGRLQAIAEREKAFAEHEKSPAAQEARRRRALENATEFERAVAGVHDPSDDEQEAEGADKKEAAKVEETEDKGPKEPTEGELLFASLKSR